METLLCVDCLHWLLPHAGVIADHADHTEQIHVTPWNANSELLWEFKAANGDVLKWHAVTFLDGNALCAPHAVMRMSKR